MIAPIRIALLATVTVALMAASLARVEANPEPKPKLPAGKAAKAIKAAKPVKVTTDTRVYLMRGLLNVFSLGMDTLSERLNAMGIEAEVFNHNGWITIANKVAEDRKRGHTGAVVVIGHSLGADVMFQLTEKLEKENIQVRLAVFFDPTISHDISKNVEHVLNLYQLNGFGRKVTAPKGYKGELVNMDLSADESIGHGSIDKSPKLHDLVVDKIMKVAVGPQRKRPVPARPKPVATSQPPATASGKPAAPADQAIPASAPASVPSKSDAAPAALPSSAPAPATSQPAATPSLTTAAPSASSAPAAPPTAAAPSTAASPPAPATPAPRAPAAPPPDPTQVPRI